MLGVSIRMDVAVIAELLAKMPAQPPCSPDAEARAMAHMRELLGLDGAAPAKRR